MQCICCVYLISKVFLQVYNTIRLMYSACTVWNHIGNQCHYCELLFFFISPDSSYIFEGKRMYIEKSVYIFILGRGSRQWRLKNANFFIILCVFIMCTYSVCLERLFKNDKTFWIFKFVLVPIRGNPWKFSWEGGPKK